MEYLLLGFEIFKIYSTIGLFFFGYLVICALLIYFSLGENIFEDRGFSLPGTLLVALLIHILFWPWIAWSMLDRARSRHRHDRF